MGVTISILISHEYLLYFRIMHDEVSETENIRKNLAIERMIVEGCEVLLDTSQTFVRQGKFVSLSDCNTDTEKTKSQAF